MKTTTHTNTKPSIPEYAGKILHAIVACGTRWEKVLTEIQNAAGKARTMAMRRSITDNVKAVNTSVKGKTTVNKNTLNCYLSRAFKELGFPSVRKGSGRRPNATTTATQTGSNPTGLQIPKECSSKDYGKMIAEGIKGLAKDNADFLREVLSTSLKAYAPQFGLAERKALDALRERLAATEKRLEKKSGKIGGEQTAIAAG